MLIDWFTVGAQALNFIVLVGLMRRFLYKPILAAIDARETKVAAVLADADARRAEARRERDKFQKKNEELDLQRGALLNEATEAAAAERQRLVDAARAAADTLRAQQLQTLRSDADRLNQALLQTTQNQVFAIARRALADLASTDLEARMAAVFTERLRQLDGDARTLIARALETGSEPAVIRSAFDLGDAQHTAIQTALDETFSRQVRVQFDTVPELVGGIEFVAHEQKVAWSIREYLTELEKSVAELVAGAGPATASAEDA